MMHERISYETYRNHQIMIVDYSQLRLKELGELMSVSRETIKGSGKNDHLLLEIVEGVKIDRNTSSTLKNYSAEIKPYLSKYATVGIKGGTRVLASMLKTLNIITPQVCTSKEDALKYLVK